MTRYLIRQGLLSLAKLFAFLSLMFFLIQIMMPGDYVDQFSMFCDQECRQQLRAQLGLDLPIGQRYLRWLKQVLTLDLGNSLTGRPVVEIMKDVIPASLLVFLTGTLLAFLIGLWLGKRTAWHGSNPISRLATLGGLLLFTSFPPWLAWLVTYAFTRGRDFMVMGEAGGLRSISLLRMLTTDLWIDVEVSPVAILWRMFLTLSVSGLIVGLASLLVRRRTHRQIPVLLLLVIAFIGAALSWIVLDIQALAFDLLKAAWLPTLTYTLLSFGETMVIMQSSMTDVLKEEYINTAYAKGLPVSVVRDRHAARNALLPVLSRLVISLPYLVTGVVIVESSFGWPGMGTNMWNALYWQNIPVVMGTLLLVGMLSLLARLVLDVLIAYLDPRIRYDQPQPSAL